MFEQRPAIDREEAKLLGSVIRVPKFSIGVASLATLAVAVLTLTFWRGSQQTRDTLTFFVLAGALAGGGVSAFYVWAGVKTAILQRQATAREHKILFALDYLTRWNNPEMGDLHRNWRQLTGEIERNPGGIVALIKDDLDKRTTTVNIMNFFEEAGYSARSGLADLPTLKACLGALAVRSFKITRPWIDYRRESDRVSTAWNHFEWLADQWKDAY